MFLCGWRGQSWSSHDTEVLPIAIASFGLPQCKMPYFWAKFTRMVMRISLLVSLLVVFISGNAVGQHTPEYGYCNSAKGNINSHETGQKTTVDDVREDNYDMKYVKLNISMTNVATTISGDVITVAQVVSDTFSEYVFEIMQPLSVDSVLINGRSQSYDTAADVCTVMLDTALVNGDMFTAQIFYGGTPVSGTRYNTKGISTLNSPSWDNWATFTLSEPYSAKNWWPCKQSLRDKIDSADIWITVDDSLKAASNGTLTSITTVAPGKSRYEWKERYPIDYYLISASVAKYVDYSFYMHFDESVDTMLIQNYVYDNPLTMLAFKNVIDSTEQQVNYFSSIFGRYPFWKEKYGHAMAPLSGGMEHQTMTTLGFFQSWLVAHELGHQWFGDHVTCSSWGDIVMNEGFAAYCEYLYLDHFRSHAVALGDIVKRQDTVRNQPGGSLFVADTSDVGRVFSSKITYDKGACVIHALRHVLNNDTYFFDLLRGWQAQKANSTGSIREFRDLAKTMFGATVNGISMDAFFDQWFFKEGFPIYDIRWNQSGEDVFVEVKQRPSIPASVSIFTVPLELKLQAAVSDTVIRIVNNEAVQMFHFKWGKSIMGVQADPNQWLIDSVASSLRDVSLSLVDVERSAISVFPNPTSSNWTVDGITASATLSLTDITGKEVWTKKVDGEARPILIPSADLSGGIYILTIYDVAKGKSVYKLVKN